MRAKTSLDSNVVKALQIVRLYILEVFFCFPFRRGVEWKRRPVGATVTAIHITAVSLSLMVGFAGDDQRDHGEFWCACVCLCVLGGGGFADPTSTTA